ncbi:hypothetical protein BN1708_019933, partial [Verticillium longisporum]
RGRRVFRQRHRRPA